jgi:transposase
LLEVGFRPRRIAALLAIDPHLVYRWQRRFKAGGLLALSTHRRAPSERSTLSETLGDAILLELADAWRGSLFPPSLTTSLEARDGLSAS